jgi:hypothetical protein
MSPLADLSWLNSLRRFQAGAFGQKQAHGGTTMVFAHGRVKISGRLVLWMALMSAPLHEQAVADAAEQTRHEHAARVANATTVVVVRNIQALVQAVFDAAKTGAVQFQPLWRVEFLRFRAGQQRNVFIVATLGLAQ